MKRIISTLAVLALLIPFITMMILQDYYGLNRPESAQVEIGRTIPIQILYARRGYKIVVYVTTAEAKWLHIVNVLTSVGAGIFACCVIVGVVKAKRDSDDK